MKNLNPHSLTLPKSDFLTTGLPSFSGVVFFMKEIWKDVVNYEGRYKVSNIGNVKSLNYNHTRKERVLRKIISHGYLKVGLSKDGKCKLRPIHQLVAESFLGHTPNGHKLVCNHINFNKKDNRVENIEIVTSRENSNQKHIKSSSKFVGVSWNKKDEVWMSYIWYNGKLRHLGCFTDELEASKAYQKELRIINP